MRLMIDIPDKIYETVQNGTYCGTLYEELKNGTPLPKGHGRLIDADMVCDELEGKSFSTSSDYHNAIDAVDDAPTIIEADKAEKGDKE